MGLALRNGKSRYLHKIASMPIVNGSFSNKLYQIFDAKIQKKPGRMRLGFPRYAGDLDLINRQTLLRRRVFLRQCQRQHAMLMMRRRLFRVDRLRQAEIA